MSNHNRRQTLVVDPRQQLRMLTSVALLPAGIVLGTATVLALVYLEADKQLSQAMIESPTLLMGILGAICFLFASVALQLLLGLRASHHIFGPAHRIARSLDAVMEGRLNTRIRLRKGDHMLDLAARINEFLEWLETHPPQGVAKAENIDGSVDDLPPLPSVRTPTEVASPSDH